IRPLDSPLFDYPYSQHWTFLILDEAHQYRGTRGAEMGLLLRRLKQRLRDSGNTNRFQCIATSASLAGGKEDRASVASFASMLFDEPFEADDVILARTEEQQSGSTKRFSAEAYTNFNNAILSDDRSILEQSGYLHSIAQVDRNKDSVR